MANQDSPSPPRVRPSSSAVRRSRTEQHPYRTVGLRYQNKQDLLRKLKEGLSPLTFDRLQDALDVPAKELYELAHIPQRTLYRRRSEGRLQPDESERVLRLAFLYEFAERVLGSRERALTWLKKPHHALGGASPLQYADTELGAREVEELLGRIEHGIPF